MVGHLPLSMMLEEIRTDVSAWIGRDLYPMRMPRKLGLWDQCPVIRPRDWAMVIFPHHRIGRKWKDTGLTGSYNSDAPNLDLSNFSPAVKSRYVRLWGGGQDMHLCQGSCSQPRSPS